MGKICSDARQREQIRKVSKLQGGNEIRFPSIIPGHCPMSPEITTGS